MADMPITTAEIRYRLRRGMLELDALLHRFFEACYAQLSPSEQAQFAELLKLEDPQLYQLLIGVQDPDNETWRPLLAQIQSFAKD